MNERDKELAKQAGMFYRECSEEFCSSFADGVLKEEMENFATLIRADEREACVKFLERIDLGNLPLNMLLHYGMLIDSLINGIRARSGEKK